MQTAPWHHLSFYPLRDLLNPLLARLADSGVLNQPKYHLHAAQRQDLFMNGIVLEMRLYIWKEKVFNQKSNKVGNEGRESALYEHE